MSNILTAIIGAGIGVGCALYKSIKNSEIIVEQHNKYLENALKNVPQNDNGLSISKQIGDATNELKRWEKSSVLAKVLNPPNLIYIGVDTDDDDNDNDDSSSETF